MFYFSYIFNLYFLSLDVNLSIDKVVKIHF